MVGRKRVNPDKLLTEVEFELMNVIWDQEFCTVKDVQLSLPKGRDLAYTSVATIMKILEEKKYLQSQKKDKAHTYIPTISRTEYEAIAVRHVSTNVFRGDPKLMVMRLLEESELNEAELKDIRALLEKAKT